MARYSCFFTVSVPFEHLQPLLVELLRECKLDVQYCTSDYILARETPGHVSFSRLVAVEVLIDKSTATETETKMSIVTKNEELPLQINNHCRKIFEVIKQAIEHNRHWHLLETIVG
jgi:hypothetical protein